MTRNNIFEIVSSKWDLGNDVDRIIVLFQDIKTVQKDHTNYTIKDYVSWYLFDSWNSRGHMLNINDFLKEVDFEQLRDDAKLGDQNSFFCIVEIVYTFCNLIKAKRNILVDNDFKLLQTIMFDCISHYNYTIYYDDEKEQAIVVEDKSEVTAVAEILEPEISLSIIRYNHFTMKGDIQTKKSILIQMGRELEPKRDIVKYFNDELEKHIFTLLNTMHLRHNNCDEGSSAYKESVAGMTNDELEDWYDELYEMMLLGFLGIEQQDRNIKCKELEKKFKNTPQF